MARHIFVVDIEVSNENKEEVRETFELYTKTWLENVGFITNKKEQVVRITNFSPVRKELIADIENLKNEEDGHD